jgi:hypothetical protein
LFIPADDFTTTLGVFTLPVISSFAVRALMFRPIPVLTSNYAWHAFQAKVQEALRSGDNAQYHLGLNVEEGLFIDFFFQQKDKEPVLATLIWGKNFPKQKEATKAPEQLRLFDDQPTQTVRQTELPFGNRDSRGLPMDASLESTEEPFSYRGGLSWPFPT